MPSDVEPEPGWVQHVRGHLGQICCQQNNQQVKNVVFLYIIVYFVGPWERGNGEDPHIQLTMFFTVISARVYMFNMTVM